MTALIIIAFVAGYWAGWFFRGFIARRFWKASLRLRDAAMGVSRLKGGDKP